MKSKNFTTLFEAYLTEEITHRAKTTPSATELRYAVTKKKFAEVIGVTSINNVTRAHPSNPSAVLRPSVAHNALRWEWKEYTLAPLARCKSIATQRANEDLKALKRDPYGTRTAMTRVLLKITYNKC